MAEDEWVDDQPEEGEWVDDNQPEEKSLANRIGHMATSVLPTVGMVGAGLLATPESFGAATVPAAALGYAGGKELEGFINNRFLGDEPESVEPMDQVNRVGSNLMKGASYEMGGQALSAAAPMVGKAIDRGVEEVATSPWMGEKAVAPIKSAIKTAGKGLTTGGMVYGGTTGDILNSGMTMAAGKATDMAADKIAPLAGKGLEQVSQMLMKAPKFAELAQVNPQAFSALAQNIADKMSETNKSQEPKFDNDQLIQKTAGSKYAPVLQRASQRGNHALGAANYILQSTDPNYRKMVLGDEQDEFQ